jgi:hypothetical protein
LVYFIITQFLIFQKIHGREADAWFVTPIFTGAYGSVCTSQSQQGKIEYNYNEVIQCGHPCHDGMESSGNCIINYKLI